MNDNKNFLNNQSQETKNVLVISDLADNVNEQDLSIFFEQFKESILVIQFNRARNDYMGGKSNSVTIIFKEFKEAEKAKYELNMRKLKGKTVRITWHERDSAIRYNNQVNLYIKNIPLDVTSRQFYEYFYTFGEITSAKLVEDEEGNHLGYGYVHFASNESKNKCLEATNDKEIWKGAKLVVENFQKRQERGINNMNPNKSIFMKNFPSDYDEGKLKTLIASVGVNKLSWIKIMNDPKGRPYAIIILDNEEDTIKIKNLNKKVLDKNNTSPDNELFVDNLMNKHDRKRYITSKIYDQNMQLTRKFKDCNLHIKNLPSGMKEDDLRQLFSQFGQIKSVKIPQTITVTKIKGEFVENSISCCYGFVCFVEPESAKEAFENLNDKLLEGSTRPIIINYFMPKNERTQVFSTMNKKNMTWDGFSNYNEINNLDNYNYYNQNIKGPRQNNSQNHYQKNQGNNNKKIHLQQQNIQKEVEKQKQIDEPDYDLLKNMEDDSSKKEYLGEFIFRKIESHKLSEANNLTMDHIGKITGMILGIEDVNEIIEICRSNDQLTSRIIEALNLLTSH